MKRFLERLAMVAFVAMIVFASGDTYVNLVATITSAAIMACCKWKLNTLSNE